ncbi:MAG: tetratricopeptide repeat protein [Bacteroidales bacterium]|nr:tetratricopeptide repeat protein [Bacteroidales bacterium]
MSIRALVKAGLISLLICIPVYLSAQQTRIYDDPEASYTLGLDLIEKMQFGAAQEVFHGLLNGLPAGESVMRLDAQFFDALCDYKLDHPGAKQKFTDFIRYYPDHSRTNQAFLYLGFVHYGLKKYKDAIEQFTKVDPFLLSPPLMSEYLYKMGYCYIQQENYDKAREVLFPILNTESEYHDAANYYYAQIAYLEQDYDKALKYFRKLNKNSEFGKEIPFYILQIEYTNKNYDEIASIGPGIIENDINDKKKKAEAARIVAEAFFINGDYENSLEFFNLYQSSSSKSLTREENYQLAYAYYQIGEYAKAIEKFQKVAGSKDEMAQNAYYHLAGCYLETNEKKFAQNAFYSAYQIEGNEKIREDALFNYAKLTYELAYDPFNSSIQALTQYISDYPGSDRLSEAYLYLTNIFLSTKDYQTAIDAIEKIRIKNQNLKAAYQKITYQRAIQLFNALKYDQALVNFNKSLSNNYDKSLTARARYWAGETYFRMENYTKSIDYYDDFMVSPGAYELDLYPMTKYNLGYAYFKLKYYDNAVITFQQFVSRPAPKAEEFVTDAILRMGDCYFITKNYKEAIDEYSRAIKRKSPDSDYAIFQKALSQGATGNNMLKIESLKHLTENYPGSSYADDAYFEIAESYLLTNENQLALDWFGKMMTGFPKSSYVIKALQKSGLIYYNQNNYNDAIATMKKIVADYPGTAEAKEALGTIRNIYIDKNAVGEYYAYAETVPFANVTVSEQDSVTYLAAEMLYMNNNCSGAVSAFADYQQQFPNGAFILNSNYYRAECDYKLGNKPEALTGYNFVLENPTSKFTENALVKAGELNLGFEDYSAALENYQKLEQAADYQSNITLAINGQLTCNYMLRNYKEAIAVSEKLLNREKLNNDQLLNAHYLAAKSALAIENFSLATEKFETTTKLSDGEKGAEAKYMLTSIQFQLKNYQKAEEMVFELVNDYAAFEYWKAKAFIMLADIYAANNNVFQARQTLQSIIDNYPGEDLKNEALEKLSLLEKQEAEKERQKPDTTGTILKN